MDRRELFGFRFGCGMGPLLNQVAVPSGLAYRVVPLRGLVGSRLRGPCDKIPQTTSAVFQKVSGWLIQFAIVRTLSAQFEDRQGRKRIWKRYRLSY